MPNLTSEQQAIITAARDSDANLLIEARAGTGKTFTLVNLLSHLRGSTVLMAFNKSIATELDQRTAHLPMDVKLQLDIGTVHALGLKAYTRNNGSKPRINGGKVSFIQKDLLASNGEKQKYFKKAGYLMTQIVSAAKNSGFGLVSPHEQFGDPSNEADWISLIEHFGWDTEFEALGISYEKVIPHVQMLLNLSNNQSNIIDFDDMIYLPLLRNYLLPTYNNVLIDEAQDISATRREMAFRMLKPSASRIIAVGDEFQAIYGFTGADAYSLANIKRRSNATTLPLTTCWRCDADIITSAQAQVPDIRCKPNAPSGRLATISASIVESALMGNLPAEKLEALAPDLPRAGDAILCRLNKPNVAMALMLLRAGQRARIEGRDLGKKLLSHVKASSSSYPFLSLHQLIIETEDWCRQQATLLASKDRQAQAALLEDEVSCAILLMERTLEQGGDAFYDLETTIEDLFGDDIPSTGIITLSSVHKAKGREWPRVFILGQGDYMPFFLATQPWEQQQEKNLIYVAKTRAEHELINITSVKEWIDSKKKD